MRMLVLKKSKIISDFVSYVKSLPNNVNPVIEFVPECFTIGVVKEERIDGKRHEYLDDNFDAEHTHRQQPGAQSVVRPEVGKQPRWEDY